MKIVLAGNYGAKNIGDEMILGGLITMIKEVSPKADIFVLSGDPQKTSELYNVKSAKKFPAGIRSFLKYLFNSNKTKKYIKDCDYFILGGGGLFGSLSFKANIIWGIQAYMAYRHGKKVLMYGQSIGKLNGRFRKWIVKKLFNKASLITVRDDKSKNTLHKIGVSKRIYVIPDMAFRKINKIDNFSKNKTFIVALRQIKNLPDTFIKEISAFINWLIENQKWNIKIINFQTGNNNYSDNIIHKKLIKNLIKEGKYDFIQEITDIGELLNEFLNSEMVLGMRLHSIITAIKTNIPFISINYAPKVKNLLKNMDLTDYMIDMDDISFQNLKNLFLKIEEKKEFISDKLRKINKSNYEKHLEFEKTTLRNFLLNVHKSQDM